VALSPVGVGESVRDTGAVGVAEGCAEALPLCVPRGALGEGVALELEEALAQADKVGEGSAVAQAVLRGGVADAQGLGVPLSLCVVEGEIELEGLTLGVSAALGVELSEIEGVAE
jgi:hypothetical protein